MTALKIKNEILRLITDMDDPQQLEQVRDFITDDVIMTKEERLEEFKEGLKGSFRDIKLHQEGKIKLKTAKEFLDEL